MTRPSTLGDVLGEIYPGSSRRARKEMAEAGRVRVDGEMVRRLSAAIAAGARVEVSEHGSSPVRVANLPPGLALVHEDDDLLVVDKAPGLLTIATARERERTVYAFLGAHLRRFDPRARVFIVHRLDREASGLLVFARTTEAKRSLQEQFRAHRVERVYAALVEGRVEKEEGEIDAPLLEDASGRVLAAERPGDGRRALTRWRRIGQGEGWSLLEVRIGTGRKHQVRVHLASIGHPVVGDRKYGRDQREAERLALHARSLAFDHPRTGERMRFASEPPASFRKMAREIDRGSRRDRDRGRST